MIIVFHNNIEVLKIKDVINNKELLVAEKNIFRTLRILAKKFNNATIGWCNHVLEDQINLIKWSEIFHHSMIMSSYDLKKTSLLKEVIGYIDQSCFVNYKQNVKYPTWIASADVGGVSANFLNSIETNFSKKYTFEFILNIIAKQTQQKGLLCYSDPRLLVNGNVSTISGGLTYFEVYLFVKTCYKKSWLYLLTFLLLLDKKKNTFYQLCHSFFYNKITFDFDFSKIEVQSKNQIITDQEFKLDVIIPTLKRKEHLQNVLIDLSKQTHLPKKVILVEQNPETNSTSELDFLNAQWPFQIKHIFIHQLGACNARNLALSEVTSNWVFFADDDIRFENNLFEKTLKSINKYGTNSVVISCLQKGEHVKNKTIRQSTHFGSGTSIVKASIIKGLTYKKEHEFGYGEDADYGMQIRNRGEDIIVFPNIKMLHLKAKTGGFRFTYTKPWENEEITPKPSPTVMAFNLKHLNKPQLLSYKVILYAKFYKNQKIKNPFRYYKSMNSKWEISEKWAKKIMNYEI